MAFRAMSWQYIAGFFDGEGCVDCRITKLPSNRTGRQFRCKIYQNTATVLRAIQEYLTEYDIPSRLEHSVVKAKFRSEKYNYDYENKDKYALVIPGAEATYCFLLEIMPYLIVKLEEAERVIAELEELSDMAQKGLLHPRAASAYKNLREV
jgi:hypothetical protein